MAVGTRKHQYPPREFKVIPCATCNNDFKSTKDHGVWKRFCSRNCFLNQSGLPKTKQAICPTCKREFTAKRKQKKYTLYCSVECSGHKGTLPSKFICPCCQTEFELTKGALKQRPENPCCSRACYAKMARESDSPAWKGGAYVAACGTVVVRKPREGFVSKYVGQHRVVASEAIGRPLERSEMVLHLDRNKQNNAPENLYICLVKEMHAIMKHGAPWPEKGNLDTYR